jgi:hypothetical protein
MKLDFSPVGLKMLACQPYFPGWSLASGNQAFKKNPTVDARIPYQFPPNKRV